MLLYFVAWTSSYRDTYRRLDAFFLHPRVRSVVASRFVFRIYSRNQPVGAAAAQRFGENTLNPVLVVLSPQGDLVLKWVVESAVELQSVDADQFAANLTGWSGAATASTQQIVEAAEADPSDVLLAQRAAQRAWARRDGAEFGRWLDAVAAADESPAQGIAARARWQGVLSEVADVTNTASLDAARRYLWEFPAHGMPAARMLAAAGAPAKEVDAAIVAVVRQADLSREEGGVQADLNAIAYDGLEMGANDGALAAALAQVPGAPTDANAYDTLAQVHIARHEFDRAVEATQRGLEICDWSEPAAETLRATLRQAETRTSTFEYSCRRQLARSLIRLPGEDLLFVDELPAVAVQRALGEPLATLAKECLVDEPASPAAALFVVRLGAAGAVADVDVLAPEMSERARECLRSRARELRVTVDAPGLEVVVTARPAPD